MIHEIGFPFGFFPFLLFSASFILLFLFSFFSFFFLSHSLRWGSERNLSVCYFRQLISSVCPSQVLRWRRKINVHWTTKIVYQKTSLQSKETKRNKTVCHLDSTTRSEWNQTHGSNNKSLDGPSTRHRVHKHLQTSKLFVFHLPFSAFFQFMPRVCESFVFQD